MKQFVQVPQVVRMKGGALARMGLYLARPAFTRVFLVHSHGLMQPFLDTVRSSAQAHEIEILGACEVVEASVESAVQLLASLPSRTQAVIGLGGGKALDTGKVSCLPGWIALLCRTHIAFERRFLLPSVQPYTARPAKSLRTGLPYAVIVDTDVCLGAPLPLWCSGVGDLAAKITAVRDWKLAFHARGEQVNDLAALLSDATVYQFMGRATRDEEGVRLLATALMLNGVAMEIAGSSRPASGSEHLISHALDKIDSELRLHGLQVGVATYLVSLLQRNASERIAELFERTGFWGLVRQEPFLRDRWMEAVRLAPAIKSDFYTVLTERDWTSEVEFLLREDPHLQSCFI